MSDSITRACWTPLRPRIPDTIHAPARSWSKCVVNQTKGNPLRTMRGVFRHGKKAGEGRLYPSGSRK